MKMELLIMKTDLIDPIDYNKKRNIWNIFEIDIRTKCKPIDNVN